MDYEEVKKSVAAALTDGFDISCIGKDKDVLDFIDKYTKYMNYIHESDGLSLLTLDDKTFSLADSEKNYTFISIDTEKIYFIQTDEDGFISDPIISIYFVLDTILFIDRYSKGREGELLPKPKSDDDYDFEWI